MNYTSKPFHRFIRKITLRNDQLYTTHFIQERFPSPGTIALFSRGYNGLKHIYTYISNRLLLFFHSKGKFSYIKPPLRKYMYKTV